MSDVERAIVIDIDGNTYEGILNQTETAAKIFEALPVDGSGQRWGQEIYFSIPVEAALEDGREVVRKGDLAFWPSGNAFCIFFGPTPASRGDEIRPASAVTVIGRVFGDLEPLKQVANGSPVSIESA